MTLPWAWRRPVSLALLSLVALAFGGARVSASEGFPVAEGTPEASLDPPSGAVELCAGHVTGAPLPDGRPGPHISWTLYTSTETRRALAERYHEALGDEGHTTDSDCDTWKRPADQPERFVAVCELSAEGPWRDCPPPPERAKSRILISTMARAD